MCYQINYKNQLNTSESGYTLIQISIVLIVFGMIAALSLPMYNNYVTYSKKNETEVSQERAVASVNIFRNLRGRYPCPARYDLAPDDPGYGEETNCQAMTPTPGTCVDGLCFEVSERTVQLNDGTTVNPFVIRGALPTRTLGLEDKHAIDGYGGKFSYVVTQILTDRDEYHFARGGISIIDGNEPAGSYLELPASAHYIVFSHGPDNQGAFNVDGEEIMPCGAIMHDSENCNTNAVNTTAVYRLAEHSSQELDMGGSGLGGPPPPTPTPPVVVNMNQHYDDTINFESIGFQPVWNFAEAGGQRTDSAFLDNNVDGQQAVVAQGRRLPPRANLTVDGVMGIREDVLTQRVCDDRDFPGNPSGTQSCFEPLLLAGPETASPPTHLRCDDPAVDRAPRGISNSRINCVTSEASCPSPRVATGIDANRNLICSDLGGVVCPETTRTVCGTDYTLPVSRTAGSTHRIPATGTVAFSRAERFTCNATGGWSSSPTSTSGECACTDYDRPFGTARVCGFGYTGSFREMERRVCPPGGTGVRTVYTTFSRDCICSPTSQRRFPGCPAGQSGTLEVEDVVTCAGGVFALTTTTIQNTCACGLPPTNISRTCNSSFYTSSGAINWRRDWNCSAVPPAWTPWYQTSNTCVCKPDDVTTSSCATFAPALYNAGSVTNTCKYTCDKPNNWGTRTCTNDTSSCGCIPSSRDLRCPTGHEPADPTVGYKEVVTCAGNVIDETKVIGSCKPITMNCRFKATGSPFVTGSNAKLTFEDDQSCSYTFGDATSSCLTNNRCYKTSGVGRYDWYNCRCE